MAGSAAARSLIPTRFPAGSKNGCKPASAIQPATRWQASACSGVKAKRLSPPQGSRPTQASSWSRCMTRPPSIRTSEEVSTLGPHPLAPPRFPNDLPVGHDSPAADNRADRHAFEGHPVVDERGAAGLGVEALVLVDVFLTQINDD